MKKTIFIVALSIAGFIAVWRFEPTPAGSSTAIAQPPAQVSTQAPATTAPTTAPSTSPGDGGTPGSSTSATPTPSNSDSSKGTTLVVQGSAQSSQFGTVQVSVTFSGKSIKDIQLLQAPTSGRGGGALPTLQQEALTAQSANIDTVSGATETSESYKASLQAAIDARGA